MWLSWVLGCEGPDPGDTDEPVVPPHNVLVLVLDDVGIERLPLYGVGETWATTPTLDSLAAEGVSFRTVWAAPVCSPSRAALLTGRYAARTGFGTVNPPQFHWVLPQTEVTLPEMLRHSPSAYTDAAIGKWHLGDRVGSGTDHPLRSGFSRFTGSMNNLDEGWGDIWPGELDYDHWIRDVDGELDIVNRYATLETTDEALRFITEAPSPWFLYLSYNAAHSPLTPPPPELFSGPWDPQASDERKQRWMIEALDTEIARLLEGMGAEVRADTTLIVVGDNGTPDFAPTGELTADRLKRSPFEGGLRVPLIVTGPHVDEPGSWSEAFVHVTDVFPTVAELAHVDLSQVLGVDGLPLRLDGQSLLPFVEDPGAQSERNVLFSEFFGPNGPPPYQEGFRTVRDRDFKLIRSLTGEADQLYDLRGRVFEGQDLMPQGLDSEQQRAYDELSDTLESLLAERPYEGPG
jgi:arylsulfatase B